MNRGDQGLTLEVIYLNNKPNFSRSEACLTGWTRVFGSVNWWLFFIIFVKNQQNRPNENCIIAGASMKKYEID